MQLKRTGTNLLGFCFTWQPYLFLLLLALLFRLASYRFSDKSPVSAIFLQPILVNFLWPLHSLIHVFNTRFNHLVLGYALYLLIILPFSVYLFHPFFVSGLHLRLVSTLSPTKDFRLPLLYSSCVCSSGMLHGTGWLVSQCSALSQSNSDIICTHGTDCSTRWIS